MYEFEQYDHNEKNKAKEEDTEYPTSIEDQDEKKDFDPWQVPPPNILDIQHCSLEVIHHMYEFRAICNNEKNKKKRWMEYPTSIEDQHEKRDFDQCRSSPPNVLDIHSSLEGIHHQA